MKQEMKKETIATLGPNGTFSNNASKCYSPEAILKFERTIWDVFSTVSSAGASKGVVPIENSLSGTVGLTIDALMRFNLHITDEIILPIDHNIASFGDIGSISLVYVHPVTYEQCERTLHKLMPHARYLETTSNADSASRLRKARDKKKAAIISRYAAGIYSLPLIKKDIMDSAHNVTKFIVVEKQVTCSTGKDRTSIAVYPQADKPGLLYSLLGIFARQKINLTKIESVPSKGKLGDYIFYIEFEGHQSDEVIQKALSSIEKHFFLKVLGSYPRRY